MEIAELGADEEIEEHAEKADADGAADGSEELVRAGDDATLLPGDGILREQLERDWGHNTSGLTVIGMRHSTTRRRELIVASGQDRAGHNNFGRSPFVAATEAIV